jgi:hypothetical protein
MRSTSRSIASPVQRRGFVGSHSPIATRERASAAPAPSRAARSASRSSAPIGGRVPPASRVAAPRGRARAPADARPRRFPASTSPERRRRLRRRRTRSRRGRRGAAANASVCTRVAPNGCPRNCSSPARSPGGSGAPRASVRAHDSTAAAWSACEPRAAAREAGRGGRTECRGAAGSASEPRRARGPACGGTRPTGTDDAWRTAPRVGRVDGRPATSGTARSPDAPWPCQPPHHATASTTTARTALLPASSHRPATHRVGRFRTCSSRVDDRSARGSSARGLEQRRNDARARERHDAARRRSCPARRWTGRGPP